MMKKEYKFETLKKINISDELKGSDNLPSDLEPSTFLTAYSTILTLPPGGIPPAGPGGPPPCTPTPPSPSGPGTWCP